MENGIPSVFISYSHKDAAWKDRLVTHLRSVGGCFDLWDDTRIGVGDEWRAEIRMAIDAASVAILLVSAHFLSSRFIVDEEIPRLLDRRRSQGLRVFPVVVTACQWQRIPWLAPIQARPRGDKALAGLAEYEAEEALSSFAGEIDDVLRRMPTKVGSVGFGSGTRRRIDAMLAETLSILTDRLFKLFQEKDRQDAADSSRLDSELESNQRELLKTETELRKTADRSRGEQVLSQRTERLRTQFRQLQAERASLSGQRTLGVAASAIQASEAMMEDLAKTARWAQQVNFLDARRSRRLDQIYVHLDIFLYPRRIRGTLKESISTVPFEQLLSHAQNHIVLLGQAGAGKTTSMKRLFSMLYMRSPDDPLFSLPFVIRFRDLNSSALATDSDRAGILYAPLLRALKIQAEFSEKLQREQYRAERREYQRMLVTSLLDAFNATIILDGFDELVGSENRETALAEIRELAISLDRARLVVTSRTGDFNYSVDGMDQYEIAPLDDTQIAAFARNWLGDDTRAADFVAQVAASPFKDTTIRPLSLAHLCAIYERAGSVPDRPKTVYRKVVGLLLEEWDEQRSVRRRSTYENFTPDRRFEFLCSLAFVLTSKFETTAFGTEVISRAYDIIHSDFGLPSDQVYHVINEIEGQTGLFLCSGYDQFEFAHKSLQEYLAAEYIVRLPNMPTDATVLQRLPNEIAITIAISSDPAGYLCKVVFEVLQGQRLPRSFYDVFVDRLTSEHPDFGLNASAALAIIVLVSLWSCRGGKSDATSTPREVSVIALDRLCVQFADLLGAYGRQVVRAHYIEETIGTTGFVEMRRAYHQPRGYRIPTRLFVPNQLADVLGLSRA